MRRSTYALRDRGLVTVSRRGGGWRAEVTEAGRFYLQHGHHPDHPAHGRTAAGESKAPVTVAKGRVRGSTTTATAHGSKQATTHKKQPTPYSEQASRRCGRHGCGPRPGPAAVPQRQCGDRGVLGVGGEAGQPYPVGVGEGQLGAGMGAFLPDDQPHALRPVLQAVAVQFGRPGAVADLAARLDGHCPGGGGNLEDGLVDGVGDDHADRVRQPPAILRQPGHELMGATAGITADQRLASAPILLRQLGQCG